MTELDSLKFEKILSSLADAVVTISAGGVIGWMNSSAEQILDVSLSTAVGKDFSTVFPIGSPIQTSIVQVATSGVSMTNHDTIFIKRNTEPVSVDVSVHPLRGDETGEVVLILRDIGVLKSLERHMTMNDRLEQMALMSAGIAHEIKNPLAGIRGAAQLLKKEVADDSAVELADLVISESDRINRLIEDFIELNRPREIKREPMNIYPALDEALRLVHGEIEKKGITVSRRFDPSLPDVMADQDKIRQVFLNLVKNGVEACSDGGEIALQTKIAWLAPHSSSLEKEKRFALVEIVDDGNGIDAETKLGLFTPFFSRNKKGMGLGLAVSMGIVMAHNGVLELGNRNDGESGAVASVYVPLAG